MDVSTEHIEIRDGALGPKPVIRGTRIRVEDIVGWYQEQDWSVSKIVEEFPHLTPAGVHAALAYYWDTNPGMIRQAAHALAQVLADTSP